MRNILIRCHLMFCIEGKSMRVRTDFSVFRWNNVCSNHRMTCVRVCVPCRCCTECRSSTKRLQYKDSHAFTALSKPAVWYPYRIVPHNWSHWPVIGKTHTSIVILSSHRGGGTLPPTLCCVHCFVQQLHMSTVSLGRCPLQEEIHGGKYAESQAILTSLLYNGYRVFPRGKAAGAWRWPSTPIYRRG
jgi:hypothetical protein